MRRPFLWSAGLFVAVAAVIGPSRLAAQSLSAGTLVVVVTDSSGAPVADVSVLATNRATGIGREGVTDVRGEVLLRLLPAGDYVVRAERLGYRPQVMTGPVVRPGRRLDLAMTIVAIARPAMQADSVQLSSLTALDTEAGQAVGLGDLDLRALPDHDRNSEDALRATALAFPDMSAQGLPSIANALMVDGLSFTGARHAVAAVPAFETLAFPRSEVLRAELVTNALDVEWSGAAGPSFLLHTRGGTGRFQVRAFGDYSGAALTSSKYYATDAVPSASLRAGVLVSGPVVADSAAFLIGAEVRRLETPRPPTWENRALDSLIIPVARDSFGTDLAPYAQPGIRTTEAAAVFGGFDWQVTDQHALSLRARLADLGADDPDLGAGFAPTLGGRLEGRDMAASAIATSIFGRGYAQELRLGVDLSRREWLPGPLPTTTFADGSIAFGTDGVMPGEFRRFNMHGSATGYTAMGRHRLKTGLAIDFASYDQTFAYGRPGTFAFGGAPEFATLTGAFTQTVGQFPATQFSQFQVSVYAQDVWIASPGLEVLLGMRYEHEQLPEDEISRNQAWLDSTGIDNTIFQNVSRRWLPRLGVTWDVRNRHRWVVRLNGGQFRDRFDPGLFGEFLIQDGGEATRRAVGALGSWPTVPDSTVAPPNRSQLTLLPPRFAVPRTRRGSFGVSHAVSRQTSAHFSVTYRHTDFLARRHDLNLLPSPSGFDQYGRPLYGTLVQQGSLLSAVPGSNRRFQGFDLVSAMDVDGSSDYVDISIGFDKRAGNLQFATGYTYSRTRDNWLTGRAAGGSPAAQLTPFPDSLAGQDWARGVSDFDVPHRATVAAEWKFPGSLDFRIGALYRYDSGLPFTPGFARGVDANGDGSGENDPAYVDDAIPGIDSLLTAWECLQTQVGQFAERNSCREPAQHALDVRVTLGLSLGRIPVALVIDAINLIEPDAGLRDRALYLVDRTGTVTTNPVTAVTTVPLVANPAFGSVVARTSPGRTLRAGLRITY